MDDIVSRWKKSYHETHNAGVHPTKATKEKP
jgi:hypothetical protein